ncbi:hypothetical protein IWZ01DRAFT_538655 [Phyllosticta capitalensis]
MPSLSTMAAAASASLSPRRAATVANAVETRFVLGRDGKIFCRFYDAQGNTVDLEDYGLTMQMARARMGEEEEEEEGEELGLRAPPNTASEASEKASLSESFDGCEESEMDSRLQIDKPERANKSALSTTRAPSDLSARANVFYPTPRSPVRFAPGVIQYNYLGGSTHAPKQFSTRAVQGEKAVGGVKYHDPAHQLLAGHRVASYPSLNSNTDNVADSVPEPAEAKKELSQPTVADIEQTSVLELLDNRSASVSPAPLTPTAQIDGAFADQDSALAVLGDSTPRVASPADQSALTMSDDTPVHPEDPNTAVTVFDDSQDQTDSTTDGNSQALVVDNRDDFDIAQDIFVEQLRYAAMEGAQVFDYDGYQAGTALACIDLTKYVFQSGVSHGLYSAEQRAANSNQDRRVVVQHGYGCDCEEAKKVQKELAGAVKEKNWQWWKAWEAKEENKKLVAAHEEEKAAITQHYLAKIHKMQLHNLEHPTPTPDPQSTQLREAYQHTQRALRAALADVDRLEQEKATLLLELRARDLA